MLTIADNVVAVAADLPPITYACAVARNTGTYVTGVAPALQLNWDLTSADWNGAGLAAKRIAIYLPDAAANDRRPNLL